MKKIILSLLISIGLVFGYGLVFSDFKNSPIILKPLFKSGNNIFLDSRYLNSIIVSFESNKNIGSYSLFSTCSSRSKFLKSFNGQYFFNLEYIDNKCLNPNIVLKDGSGKIILSSLIKLRLINDKNLYKNLLDYSDSELNILLQQINKKIKKYSIFSKYKSGVSEKNFSFLLKYRIYKEYVYSSIIIDNILISRKKKYISPVLGYNLSTDYSKLPNTGRGYRKLYTDGIHHGWDIDSPYATDVIALDDGLIIRKVEGFLPKDLNKIKKTSSLTYIDELHNLDLLRGNQVWLKTMKGEIIFYSHLSEVSINIKEGDLIKRGDILGKTGVSGIPGVGYKDYHLHFVIHENPYTKYRVGKYSFDDYMSWNWKFKGKSRDYILKNTSVIFE